MPTHIRIHRDRLHPVMGHHAEQFGASEAGPAVAEARLTKPEADELLACRRLQVGPATEDNALVHELHDAQGTFVGLIFATPEVVGFAAARAARDR